MTIEGVMPLCAFDALRPAEAAVFRPGDVVLLRSREQLSEMALERLMDHCKLLTHRTGIEFVVLDASLEVVLPKESGDTLLPEMGQPEFKQPKDRA
jgi:hypothetical protein